MSDFQLNPVCEKSQWDDGLSRCREIDLQQTWEYGDAVGACIGWAPVRQTVSRDGRPVAMAQVLTKEIPVLGWVARMQHGPLFVGDRFDPAEAEAALAFLKRHYVDDKGMELHLTPCLFPGDLPEGFAGRLGLRESDEALWASIRLDLTKGSAALREAMDRNWRRAIKKAEKSGLEFTFTRDEAAFAEFIEKYTQTTKEKGFSWPSPQLVAEIWKATPEATELGVAIEDGEWISSIVPFAYANTAYGLAAWNGPKTSDYNASNFCIWNSVLWSEARGLRWFDLGGIDEVNLPGITKFKRRLNGEEYRLIGNFEARPEGAIEKVRDVDYRKGLGHVIPGLELPEAEASEGDVVGAKVAAIVGEFLRESTGMDVEVTDDVSLVEGGLLDSLTIVSVVQALQDAFDIAISPPDITIDNFDRVPAIRDLVRRKIDERDE